MGVEVFELGFAASQARMIEVTGPDDLAAIEPCADLSIRLRRRDEGLVDSIQAWLAEHGPGLETLIIDADWIVRDRLDVLDLSPCSSLLGTRLRGLHLGEDLFDLSELTYLNLDRCLLPLEEALTIDASWLPNLVTCDFTDTSFNQWDVDLAGAPHLRQFGLAVDQDYGNGSDPFRYHVVDCPQLVTVGVSVCEDLEVEVAGDLPSLQTVSINPYPRTHDFEHGSCTRHPREEVAFLYDADRNEEIEIPLDEYDETRGNLYSYLYRF